jgi:hypothetical protein
MFHRRRRHNISGDATRYYLQKAMPPWRKFALLEFNDMCDRYDDLLQLMQDARELAQADVETARSAMRRAEWRAAA